MNILLISHNFLPMESPEAVRSGKYAKYLNRLGFNVFVLNTERKEGNFFSRLFKDPWIKPAVKEACDIINREKIDIIISQSMPIVSHKVALEIKERYPNLIWIAEFFTPWIKKRKRDKEFEVHIFLEADRIIATFYKDAELFKKEHYWAEDKIKIVSDFDGEELKDIQCIWELALMIKELINKRGEDAKDNKCLRNETELSKDSTINEGI